MQNLKPKSYIFQSQTISIFLLISTWVVGSIVGFLIYNQAGSNYSSLMHGASISAVSIVGLLLSILLPFLLTAFAVFFSCPAIVYFVCLLKAISYGLCSLSVYGLYGRAGWLAQLLIMFTENCTTLSLWVSWLCFLAYRSDKKPYYFGVCFIISAVCGIMDLLVFSPFTASVFIS